MTFGLDNLIVLERPGAMIQRRPPGRAGVHVIFENGWTVSVQWGPYNYCDNYLRPVPVEPPQELLDGLTSTTAECAVWHEQLERPRLLPWEHGDTVGGWCSFAAVQRLLDLAAAGRVPVPIPAPDRLAQVDVGSVRPRSLDEVAAVVREWCGAREKGEQP